MRDSANQLSQQHVWESSEGSYGKESVTPAMGRLAALVPPPKGIEPILADDEQAWRVETTHFPGEVRKQFDSLPPDLSFASVFAYYKTVSASSSDPPPFVTRRAEAQETFKAQHQPCACRWGRIREGWYYHWIRVDPTNGPHWGCSCPYELAIQELELGWGRVELAVSERQSRQEMGHFLEDSHLMHKAGLIRYRPEAQLSPTGHLYRSPEVWSCCEWVQSPLTELLNAAAEFELETRIRELNAWLNDIDDGLDPFVFRGDAGYLGLSKTEEGLLLLKWSAAGFAEHHPNRTGAMKFRAYA